MNDVEKAEFMDLAEENQALYRRIASLELALKHIKACDQNCDGCMIYVNKAIVDTKLVELFQALLQYHASPLESRGSLNNKVELLRKECRL